MPDFDVAIIGAGPGGYVAAIRAGQLGLKTALVERERLGGICLNWGCIPTKALLRNAEILHLFRRSEEFGISIGDLRYDFGQAVDRSRQVVDRLVGGIEGLLRKNHVEHIPGEAHLRAPTVVEVSPNGHSFSAGSIIVATGAHSRSLPGLEVDGATVVTSREALELREVPPRVVIIGGGATGVEFAYLYNAYGAHVTLIEVLPHLVPNEDQQISQVLERSFSRHGIQVLTGTRVTEATRGTEGVRLEVARSEGTLTLEADQVLVCVGLEPNTADLGLEEMGVALERGFVPVDPLMATGAAGVYAIGDVTGILPLAHVASAQGVLAVERIAGEESPTLDYQSMPRATYCQPQVASFGLTEEQARQQGFDPKVGSFPFQASGKALALGDTEGLVKVVANGATGEILGAHMIGSEVTELLGELSLARLLEGTPREVGWLVHSHPTLSEVLKEASLAVEGKPIHL